MMMMMVIRSNGDGAVEGRCILIVQKCMTSPGLGEICLSETSICARRE